MNASISHYTQSWISLEGADKRLTIYSSCLQHAYTKG